MTLNHSGAIAYLPGSTWRVTGAVNISATLLVQSHLRGDTSPVAGTGATAASRSSGGSPVTSSDTLAALRAAKNGLPRGGVGGAEESRVVSNGGAGGGGLRILAKGPITFNGANLLATGDTGSVAPLPSAGSGGGSGGVIVLVSDTSITITNSAFTMSGGTGSNANMVGAIGGGGGGGGGAGGCVILIAPTISLPANPGWLVALGGPPGLDQTPGGGSDLRHGFGGGGNACAAGGNGGLLFLAAAGIPVSDPGRRAATGGSGRAISVATGAVKPSALLFPY